MTFGFVDRRSIQLSYGRGTVDLREGDRIAPLTGGPSFSLRSLRRGLRNQDLIGWLGLAAATAASTVFIFWLQRGLTWGWDEFFWLENSGLAPSWDQWLHPYGGHLIVVPYLLYRLILEVGGASYTAFAVVQVIGLNLAALLVYIYAKRRIGPLLALAPAIVMLFLGSAWAPLLEPLIGIQFLCAIVPGLAAIVLLEVEKKWSDVAACALLCLSLAGFSEGAIFLAGAVVAVALSPRWRQRAWIVIVPALLYGGWRIWASQFESTGIVVSNIPLIPSYFVDAFAVFSTAIFGVANLIGMGPWSQIRLVNYELTFLTEGIVFAIVEVLVIVGAIAYAKRRPGGLSRAFWPILAMLLAYWVELGLILVPGRTAAESRYSYLGVMLLLLIAVEVLRGVKASYVAIAVAASLTVAAAVGNLARFHEGRAYLDIISHRELADMTVIELAGTNADPYFIPMTDAATIVPPPLTLNVGPWQAISNTYGSSAYSLPKLREQGEGIRNETDLLAIKLMNLRLVPTQVTPRGCRTLAEAGTMRLPRGGATLYSESDVEIWTRRWAGETPSALGALSAGQPARLRIPPDRASASDPWYLGVSGGPVRVCRPGRA